MNKSDLIDKYIQNKASAEELETIKQLIAEDIDFKEELTFQLELRQAVKREESKKLKQRLQGLEQKKKSGRFFSIIWKVAAVFIGGLGLLWFFNMSPDYEKIYTQNFEPYPNIVVPTVRDVNTSGSDIEKAFRYYDNHDYAKAAAAFKKIFDADKTGYTNFYYAISLMADQQVENAIEALENPGWEIPERYQNQTDWYLALGYLKTQNKEKAITYLDKVIKADGAMAEQARKIVKEIK